MVLAVLLVVRPVVAARSEERPADRAALWAVRRDPEAPSAEPSVVRSEEMSS